MTRTICIARKWGPFCREFTLYSMVNIAAERILFLLHSSLKWTLSCSKQKLGKYQSKSHVESKQKGINRGPLKRMFVFHSLEKKNKRRQNELNFFALSCSINWQSLSRYLLKMAIQPLVILNTVLYAVYLLMAANMNWRHSAEKGRVKTLSIAYVLTTRNLKLR